MTTFASYAEKVEDYNDDKERIADAIAEGTYCPYCASQRRGQNNAGTGNFAMMGVQILGALFNRQQQQQAQPMLVAVPRRGPAPYAGAQQQIYPFPGPNAFPVDLMPLRCLDITDHNLALAGAKIFTAVLRVPSDREDLVVREQALTPLAILWRHNLIPSAIARQIRSQIHLPIHFQAIAKLHCIRILSIRCSIPVSVRAFFRNLATERIWEEEECFPILTLSLATKHLRRGCFRISREIPIPAEPTLVRVTFRPALSWQ